MKVLTNWKLNQKMRMKLLGKKEKDLKDKNWRNQQQSRKLNLMSH